MHPQQPPYQPYPPRQPGYAPLPYQPGYGTNPTPQGHSQQLPTQRQYGPPPMPPAPPKRRRAWPWVVAGLVVLLLILIISSAGSSGGAPTTAGTTATASSSPPARASAQAAAVAPAPRPVAPPAPPKPITARDWAKIAKDPDAHVGEAIIVYGQVQQFDSATGVATFRANVDGVKHSVSYGYVDYETNTVLTSGGADLSDLVQGDLFKAEVTVIGSLSYDTTLGGSTTVPHLMVQKLTVTGQAK